MDDLDQDPTYDPQQTQAPQPPPRGESKTEVTPGYTRGVSPVFELGEFGRVFDPFTYGEHLKDQAFDSTVGGGTFHAGEFVRTQLLAVFMGEFAGSMIYALLITIAFSLAATTTSLPVGLVSIGLVAYLGTKVVMNQFGHISGGHCNPLISTLLCGMHVIHYVWTGGLWLVIRDVLLLVTYMVAQLSGWFVGVACAYYAIRDSAGTGKLGLPGRGVIGTSDVSHGRAFFIEFALTMVILGVYAFSVVDRAVKDKSDRKKYRGLDERHAADAMGAATGAATLVGAALTGASLNPFRWLTIFFITGAEYRDSWAVYIFAGFVAIVPVIIGVEIWRRWVERTSDGSARQIEPPVMPPANKYHEASVKEAVLLRGRKSYTAPSIMAKAGPHVRRRSPSSRAYGRYRR